jgi:hypothetical protein
MLRSLRCKVLHYPPYNPDCNFHVSGCFKEVPKGHRFVSNEDIKDEVMQWFQQQQQGIHWLVHQWNSCLNAQRDCS